MNAISTERLENGNLLVSIPIALQFTANGKAIAGTANDDASPREAILRAIARGRRWQQLIDEGTVASAGEIAKRIGRDTSYVSRLIRLATLSPAIIREVVADRLTPKLTLTKLSQQDLPDEWDQQERIFLG